MFQRMRGLFRDLPLRSKLLLIVLSVYTLLLIPSAILGGVMLYNQQQVQLFEAMESSVNSSAASIVNSLKVAQSLSGTLLADTIVQEQLALLQESDDAVVRGDVYRTLENELLSKLWDATALHVRGIRIDKDDFTVAAYSNQAAALPDDAMQDVISLAKAGDGRLVVCTSPLATNIVFVTRVVREVKHFTLAPLGVVTIAINMDRLVNEAVSSGSGLVTADCLIRQGDDVLYRSGVLSGSEAPQILGQMAGPHRLVSSGGHRFFAVTVHLEQYDWDYTCLVPFDAQAARLKSVYLMFGLLILLSMALSAALWMLTIGRISGHIHALINKMRYFSEHRMQLPATTVDYSQRKDEIGELHQQFDAMAGDITRLVEENYVKELLARDAQLRALEMQMNPHFLYNVLDSINWRAQAAGAETISQMVGSLGSLLRVALDRQQKTHTLGAEIALVGHYIAIQRIRYEDRLVYRQQIDEQVMDASLPKLVLQPLVENAVRYGLENSLEDEVVITVTAHAEEDQLVMTVTNTGSQFEGDLLARLRSGSIRPGGYGIGVMNIEDRLRLTYGTPEPLLLYNEEACAVACVRIPLRYEKEGDEALC